MMKTSHNWYPRSITRADAAFEASPTGAKGLRLEIVKLSKKNYVHGTVNTSMPMMGPHLNYVDAETEYRRQLKDTMNMFFCSRRIRRRSFSATRNSLASVPERMWRVSRKVSVKTDERNVQLSPLSSGLIRHAETHRLSTRLYALQSTKICLIHTRRVIFSRSIL